MYVNVFTEYQIQKSLLGFLKENKKRSTSYKDFAQLMDGLQMSIVILNQPTHW